MPSKYRGRDKTELVTELNISKGKKVSLEYVFLLRDVALIRTPHVDVFKAAKAGQMDPELREKYQKAVETDKMHVPMYPVPAKGNKELLRKYLLEACSIGNLIPAGRLGLYQYLNMDQAIGLAMEMEKLVYVWKGLSAGKRYEKLLKLIN